MAISVADNFSYQGTKPLDARVSFDTVAAMAAASDATLYDGCFAYVKAVQKYYSYDSTNTADPTTGKWREYSSGGGGSSDYPDLTNKPSINGVELLGNKVIGLLSGNIQVDSDKIGYDNLTSGLSATNVKDALDELANGGGGSHDMPSGGTSGQALVKASNDDYDVTWSDIAMPQGSAHEVIDNVYSKKKSKLKYDYEIKTKGWNGLTIFDSYNIWTDGDNIYYSNGNKHYVLNKSTSTWTAKTWNGLTNFYGIRVWTDGDNIYYSSDSDYVLNKSTSTWTAKTWKGLTNFDGYYIWTDGDNIYYSNGNKQYVLNKSTSTWTAKTWSGLTNFTGDYIWTDGDNIYYSSGSDYVLNKSTSTWTAKTWSGLTNFAGDYIWTDGDNIYYSYKASQYVLNKSTSTWTAKTWKELTNFYGSYIWTDGDNIYYSNSSSQYVLNKINKIPFASLKAK